MTPDEEKKISIEQLQKAYQDIFGTKTGKLVLDDLSYRCFKYTSTAALTNNQTLINEGRRQVLLHIESQLKPTTKE